MNRTIRQKLASHTVPRIAAGKPAEGFTNFDRLVATAVVKVRDGGCREVLVGPTVWELTPGDHQGRFYFLLGSGGPGGLRVNVVVGHSWSMCERLRAAIVDRLLHTPSASVYDFDDELAMARYAEAIWPDEATTRLRRGEMP